MLGCKAVQTTTESKDHMGTVPQWRVWQPGAHLVRVLQLQKQLRAGVPPADHHTAACGKKEKAGGWREGGALRRGAAVGHVVQARRQHLDAPELGADGEAL